MIIYSLSWCNLDISGMDGWKLKDVNKTPGLAWTGDCVDDGACMSFQFQKHNNV